MQTVIEVFCMFCTTLIGLKDGEGISGVSHGVCDDCAPEYSARMTAELFTLQKERRDNEAGL
jgi:hypothetical protein